MLHAYILTHQERTRALDVLWLIPVSPICNRQMAAQKMGTPTKTAFFGPWVFLKIVAPPIGIPMETKRKGNQSYGAANLNPNESPN